MLEDDPLPDPFLADEVSPDETERPSSGRSCLFLVITAVLIISLIGSSILAYFVLAGSESRSSAGVEGSEARIAAGPTAAPATVVAAVPTMIPTVAAEPASAAPEINRIAIVNEDGQIETMSPMGEDRRVLTLQSDRARFLFPAWAPDSLRLAVVGSGAGGSGIYVLADAARTGALDERQVYYSADKAPFYLFWSPDSDNLAFLSNDTVDTIGLNVVSGDGTRESRLLATGAPFYWDWSEDGRQLLIHSGSIRSANSLALIDVEGATQADNLATPGYFQAPGIGPGGRYWAFAEETGPGLSTLVVIDTQSGEHRSFEQGGSLALGWSPTDDRLAYTSGAVDGHPYWGPLRLLDVPTGESRLLVTRTVLAFFWSTDGRSIAFITLSRDEEDDVTAGIMDKVRRTSRLAEAPARQTGGSLLTLSVLDVETGEGLRLLDFDPTAIYLSQFLPYFDQYALSHRVWSPDSSALVLPVREEGGDVILVVPTHGGRPYRLAEGDMAFWSHK